MADFYCINSRFAFCIGEVVGKSIDIRGKRVSQLPCFNHIQSGIVLTTITQLSILPLPCLKFLGTDANKATVPASAPAADDVINAPKEAPKKAADASAPPAKAKAKYETVIVTQNQEQLGRKGLYDGAADGVVNPATQEAVRSYQSMNKLKADGKPTEDVLVHMLANDMQLQEPASN